MTKVIVHPGICGFSVTITAEEEKGKKVRVTLETECGMVGKMAGDMALLDMMSAFAGHLNNPVYRSAAKHLRHPACPVPSGILKAIEVELGLALKKDAVIHFVTEQEA
jgi:hypothetical protein